MLCAHKKRTNHFATKLNHETTASLRCFFICVLVMTCWEAVLIMAWGRDVIWEVEGGFHFRTLLFSQRDVSEVGLCRCVSNPFVLAPSYVAEDWKLMRGIWLRGAWTFREIILHHNWVMFAHILAGMAWKKKRLVMPAYLCLIGPSGYSFVLSYLSNLSQSCLVYANFAFKRNWEGREDYTHSILSGNY